MNVRYKCCNVDSPAGVGVIFKFKLLGLHLQNKVFFIYNVFQLPSRTPPPLGRLAQSAGWGFEYMLIVTGHSKYV